MRDVEPGEAVFINLNGEFFSKQCSENPMLFPCAFEYVYLARPDSIMNGISVYKARLKMGDYLAESIKETINSGDVDVVMPIPDSSRPAAMQVARQLGIEYREGFFKNRFSRIYISNYLIIVILKNQRFASNHPLFFICC